MSAANRRLQPEEYPTMNLPRHSHTTVVRSRKPAKPRTLPEPLSETSDSKEDVVKCEGKISMGTQVSDGSEDLIKDLLKL